MSNSAPPPEPDEDILFVHSPVEQGEGYRVIRRHKQSVEVGEIRNLKEGRPLQGDLVRLTQRAEHARLFNVEVILGRDQLPAATRQGTGPAQVASEAYRDNWDAIFGAREPSKLAN
jgi:hypothetical protein